MPMSLDPNSADPSVSTKGKRQNPMPDSTPSGPVAGPSTITIRPEWSVTRAELALISVEQAIASIGRLTGGYMDKSGARYAQSTTNLAGRQLVQKTANRAV